MKPNCDDRDQNQQPRAFCLFLSFFHKSLISIIIPDSSGFFAVFSEGGCLNAIPKGCRPLAGGCARHERYPRMPNGSIPTPVRGRSRFNRDISDHIQFQPRRASRSIPRGTTLHDDVPPDSRCKSGLASLQDATCSSLEVRWCRCARPPANRSEPFRFWGNHLHRTIVSWTTVCKACGHSKFKESPGRHPLDPFIPSKTAKNLVPGSSLFSVEPSRRSSF